MTDDSTAKPGADGARQLLTHSERTLREWLVAFEAMTGEVLEGEVPEAGEVSVAVARLAHTRTMVIQEIKAHEQRVHLSEGRLSDDPLDFDVIRNEIGRRLDRIRAARGSGGVSE